MPFDSSLRRRCAAAGAMVSRLRALRSWPSAVTGVGHATLEALNPWTRCCRATSASAPHRGTAAQTPRRFAEVSHARGSPGWAPRLICPFTGLSGRSSFDIGPDWPASRSRLLSAAATTTTALLHPRTRPERPMRARSAMRQTHHRSLGSAPAQLCSMSGRQRYPVLWDSCSHAFTKAAGRTSVAGQRPGS